MSRRLSYGLAIGLLGVLARALTQPLIGDALPFVFAYIATMLAAIKWGMAPGLTAAGVCILAAYLPAIPPFLAPEEAPLQIGAFLVSAIFIGLIAEHVRRPQQPTPATATTVEPVADTSLTSWLRTVLTGAMLVPITIFVIVAWWGYVTARSGAEQAVTRATDLAFNHAQTSFAIALGVAHRTAAITDLPDAEVRAEEPAIQRRLSDIVTGLPSIINVNVWDAQGRPLARSDAQMTPEANIADRAYFVEQRDHNPGVAITEVLQGRLTGKELVNLTIRRLSADGQFRGIVAVSLSPSFFRDYYQSITRDDPRLSTFALLRSDGVYLARWPPPPDGQDRVPASSPTLMRIVAGDTTGIHVVAPQRGREARVVGFRRVPGYPMYVAVGFSREAMFADWTRFLAILAAVMVPTTAGLVYVSWVALKKTRREQAIEGELRQEIRRRSEAERSILETQKWRTLSVLTGGVAHDFNNLLAIVSTSLHVHRRKHPALANDKHLEAMARAIAAGARLTRQLLSFSRKQPLKPEAVRLQEWLPAAADLIRSTLGANVTLALSVADDTAAIHVDPAELELALINLSINARHAMPDGGEIRITARNQLVTAGGVGGGAMPPRPMVAIDVADDGVGIDPQALPRIREPFYTTRESGSGSGLGLSQVDGFVTQSDGLMTIDSTPRRGTTVGLVFPVASSPAKRPTDAEDQPATRVQGELLLVEDNIDVAASMKSLLSSYGLTVIGVTNAADALSFLANAARMPDVVLSDIAMPGRLNGIELALRLRAERPDLPVLLTTGYADQLDMAVNAGLEVFLKPVRPEDLLLRLRTILRATQT